MDRQTLDQPLPHSPEAERAILGAMLLDGQAAAAALSLLAPEDFYVRAHQLVCRAARAVSEEGRPVDAVTVGESLRDDSLLEQVGGVAFVSGLSYGVPAMNVAPYARIVRGKALMRQIVRTANRVTTEALEGDEEPAEVLRRAEEMFSALARDNADAATHRPRSLAELAPQVTKTLERMYRGVSDAVPTGFDEIDSRLTGGGLLPKQFVLIAARPSVGKSSLMLDIAANVARKGGRALCFSLEMGAEQLTLRLLAVETGIERWKFRPGVWERDYRRGVEGLAELSKLPVWVDDTARTLARVRDYARQMWKSPETRPDVILVDYLQLVQGETRRGSRNDDVGAVSRGLKALAMELSVPVIALSQLSRDCEKQGREPELSDLRDSGELEQDADVVLFLFGNRPEEGEEFYSRTLKCAKQRDGGLFRAELVFNGPLVTFRPTVGAREEDAW